MIAVLDYRAGNLTSVMSALAHIGADAVLTDSPAEVMRAERVIFPGVGAAGRSMENLHGLGLAEPLREVVAAGTPFLGICVGFQLLFEGSDEDGGVECLGILPGRVVRFPDAMPQGGDLPPLKVPQMGWNDATFATPHPVADRVPAGSQFYFVHSFHPVPKPEHLLTRTTYGIEFASGAARGNVVGFQFHPEKSGRPGLQVLRNFCKWCGAASPEA